MLSIPEKGFLLSFLSVFIFLLFGDDKISNKNVPEYFLNFKSQIFVFELVLQCQFPPPIFIGHYAIISTSFFCAYIEAAVVHHVSGHANINQETKFCEFPSILCRFSPTSVSQFPARAT